MNHDGAATGVVAQWPDGRGSPRKNYGRPPKRGGARFISRFAQTDCNAVGRPGPPDSNLHKYIGYSLTENALVKVLGMVTSGVQKRPSKAQLPLDQTGRDGRQSCSFTTWGASSR